MLFSWWFLFKINKLIKKRNDSIVRQFASFEPFSIHLASRRTVPLGRHNFSNLLDFPSRQHYTVHTYIAVFASFPLECPENALKFKYTERFQHLPAVTDTRTYAKDSVLYIIKWSLDFTLQMIRRITTLNYNWYREFFLNLHAKKDGQIYNSALYGAWYKRVSTLSYKEHKGMQLSALNF
jgi:hypothetical protein